MEMVDMRIIRFGISDRKSRSVHIVLQRSDFGPLDLFWTILVSHYIIRLQVHSSSNSSRGKAISPMNVLS